MTQQLQIQGIKGILDAIPLFKFKELKQSCENAKNIISKHECTIWFVNNYIYHFFEVYIV